MGSWSKKIYLSFWLTLFFLTAVAALWLPQILDQGKEDSIKGLQPAPRAELSDATIGQAVTRFPTRPFLDAAPPLPVADPTPSDEPSPSQVDAPPGLPSRHVPGVDSGIAVDERVTTRAYIAANSAVYAQPQTTATVLGRVGDQTRVRWLDKAGEGWEEILLKNGRSAYVQSRDLSFSAVTDQSSFSQAGQSGADPDLSSLPATVEGFLANLSNNDLLRAETYLSPLAPGLTAETLGPLAPYTGSPPLGRVLRIELVPGERSGYRTARLVYGENMEHEVPTLWEWDRSQQRWMLVRWN